jgi:hypothetical protein
MDAQLLIVLGLAVLAGIILAVWRFSGGRYGKRRPSAEATAAYESFQVDPGKDYYVSGPDAWPNAIMGIDHVWAFESDLWKKRELTAEGMRALVQGMQAKSLERMTTLQGFDILDEKGARIGDWFSVMGLTITIRVIGDGKVEIDTPPVDAYPGR